MTDGRRVVATKMQPVSGQDMYFYELVLTCLEAGRKLELRTFQRDSAGDEVLAARAVTLTRATNWTSDSQADAGVLTFRMDDAEPQRGAFIAPDYPNVLLLDAVLPPPQSESEALSQEVLASVLPLGAILEHEIPTSRFVVAGVFPDEVMDFRFDDLTSADRATLATSCWGQP